MVISAPSSTPGSKTATTTTLFAFAASIATGIYLYRRRKSSKMTEAKCPVSGSTGKCPFASAATSYPNAAKLNKDGVVTNLSNKRSSDGMGLPESMSKETVDMIVATAPAVAPKMLDITKCFYTKVLGKHPELKQFFNTAVSSKISSKIKTPFGISTDLSKNIFSSSFRRVVFLPFPLSPNSNR